MEKMLAGKVAIITGSGRGIGQATALMFAREGARVLVSDIDPVPAGETVDQIKAAGGEAISYVGDVTAGDFAAGIVKAAGRRMGRGSISWSTTPVLPGTPWFTRCPMNSGTRSWICT